LGKALRRSVSERLYNSVIKNSVHNKEEFNIEKRSTQRSKYASILANIALKTETTALNVLKTKKKHQEDQAAMVGVAYLVLTPGFSAKIGLRRS